MAAWIEIVGSRETSVSIDAPTMEISFTVSGTDDETEVRALAEANLSATIPIVSGFFGTRTVVIQSYHVKQRGTLVWDGEAKYGRLEPRKTGDLVLTFDGTGGSAHITTSKETKGRFARSNPNPPVITGALGSPGSLALVATYWVVTAIGPNGETLRSNEVTLTPVGTTRSGVIQWPAVQHATSYRVYRSTTAGTYATPALVATTTNLLVTDTGTTLATGAPPTDAPSEAAAPDYRGAIGVTNDAVEGTDATIPSFKFTHTYYAPRDVVTAAYIVNMMTLTGRTNDSPWQGFAAGEVLFMGPSGGPRGYDDWEIAFHFIASPNITGMVIGDIEGIIKGGHEYLWLRFADSVNRNSLIKIPEFAYVERVYDPGDFSTLGIGV